MIREKLKEQMSDLGFVRCFMHLGIGCWADEVMERDCLIIRMFIVSQDDYDCSMKIQPITIMMV